MVGVGGTGSGRAFLLLSLCLAANVNLRRSAQKTSPPAYRLRGLTRPVLRRDGGQISRPTEGGRRRQIAAPAVGDDKSGISAGCRRSPLLGGLALPLSEPNWLACCPCCRLVTARTFPRGRRSLSRLLGRKYGLSMLRIRMARHRPWFSNERCPAPTLSRCPRDYILHYRPCGSRESLEGFLAALYQVFQLMYGALHFDLLSL